MMNVPRLVEWQPNFEWKISSRESADQINSFHEDYPQHVMDTMLTINLLGKQPLPIQISEQLILSTHFRIFKNKGDSYFGAGKYRDCNVRVGFHVPPKYEYIHKYMEELVYKYNYISDIDTLKSFYYDLESIHPFRDGNGRVGGVLVAFISHNIHPDKGYLTVCQ